MLWIFFSSPAVLTSSKVVSMSKPLTMAVCTGLLISACGSRNTDPIAAPPNDASMSQLPPGDEFASVPPTTSPPDLESRPAESVDDDAFSETRVFDGLPEAFPAEVVTYVEQRGPLDDDAHKGYLTMSGPIADLCLAMWGTPGDLGQPAPEAELPATDSGELLPTEQIDPNLFRQILIERNNILEQSRSQISDLGPPFAAVAAAIEATNIKTVSALADRSTPLGALDIAMFASEVIVAVAAAKDVVRVDEATVSAGACAVLVDP
jgi:hypothetical protein